MDTRRAPRRVIALSLMLALATSAAEAVAGPVRDGSVHHESNVEAASHRSAIGLDHVHMQSLELASPHASALESESGAPEHEHPGGDDHCTHVHGVALMPAVALESPTFVSDVHIMSSRHCEGLVATSLRRPPRV